MKKILICFLLYGCLYANETLDMQKEFEAMKSEYYKYVEQQKQEFKDYKDALNDEFQRYQKELKVYWKNPELSSKSRWVSYSKDKHSRSVVDFESGYIQIESIAASKQEAIKALRKQLAFSIGTSTKDVIEKDDLQKNIAKISKKSNRPFSKADDKPILKTVFFKKEVTKKEINTYVKKQIAKATIKKEKENNRFVYIIKVPLPKDTTLKRAKVYKTEVIRYASRYKVPVALVFAIIQTESNFNPFAKSHIPAFGLMQIVPRSAGVDSYQFLYKQKRQPSASYLYNSEKNIEMGSVYLYILYFRYLKKIKNPQSRLYCTIAAYNTGAGNIAWAFTRNTNINKAVSKINALSSDEVYTHLLKELKYDEPKQYLKKVRKRMSAFQKVYKNI
ncbi:DUF3393 domain-containing protein [Sulfurimonas sp. MAG313]|nr:murein transglycosylase domain-containing protein [Sulfurimonas sp. MAG313]MDF1882261.1 DUF3393 domain-containing protein [Sulfurimonas sp. MAG313]